MTAPTLTGLLDTVSFSENLVNATPQRIDTSVTLSNPDEDWNGATLTLSGLLAEDRVSVFDAGSGPGAVGLNGAEVLFGGVVIGVLVGGVGNELTITFNAAATSQSVAAVIESLTYANVSDAPTASRTLVLNVTDSGGQALDGLVLGFGAQNEWTGSANPFAGLDVGSASKPVFADLDGDGDLDLVVGTYAGGLQAFENTGAGFAAMAGADPFSGFSGPYYSSPHFADLDGDGDLDLVVGSYYGNEVSYWRNDGAVGFTALSGAANRFDGLDLGDHATPWFVDLDGDGDLDLVAGNSEGTLRTFRNEGAAGFVEQVGAANPFDSVQVGYRSTPVFADLDGDGDLDLVVGEEYGALFYFEHTASGYVARTGSANPFAGIDAGLFSAPAVADLDGDGDIDLVMGNYDGTLRSVAFVQQIGRSIVIDVTAQNDAPTVSGDLAGSLNDGGRYLLTAADLFVSDGDDAAPVPVLRVSDSVNGAVLLDGVAATAFTLADLEAGRVTFQHDPAALGHGRFRVTVEDDEGAVSDAVTVILTAIGPVLIDGTAAAETLNGTLANDVIRGFALDDTLLGFDGNDILQGDAGADTLDGGAGQDTVRYSEESARVIVNLDSAARAGVASERARDGGGATDTLVSIEHVIGSDFHDIIYGSAGANTLNGGDGNDILYGRAGDDVLIGGAGADQLEGQAGFDTVSYRGDGGAVIVNLDSATRAGIASLSARDGSGSLDTLRDIEHVVGSAFADILYGSAGRNTLDGGDGDDVLIGRGGDDTFIGSAGDDLFEGQSGFDTADYSAVGAGVVIDLVTHTVSDGQGGTDTLLQVEIFLGSAFDDLMTGHTGNDRFFGHGGEDVAHGGAGNDTLYGGADADTLQGEEGNDRLYGEAGDDLLDGDSGADNLDGGAGDDLLTGGAGGDRLYGRDGADILNGDAGTDFLYGQEGNDVLFGGADRDYLYGHEGDDRLQGDGGDDRLIGGDGTDTAVYSGLMSDYQITLNGNGTLIVRDLNSNDGDEGRDLLTGVEFVQFADGVIDVAGL